MTDKKKIDKRTAIIEASLKLFTENGFQETSTNSISKEAGVATGTLFVYFSSKDELINKIYFESKESYSSYAQMNFEETGKFENKLKKVWDQSIEWALQNPLQFKFLLQFSNSPFITKLTKQEISNSFLFLRKIFNQALEDKQIIQCDIELIISLYYSHINTTTMYFLNKPEKKDIEALAEKSFSIFSNGLKA